MKCILHIGIEKTGTTSIQFELASNRNALRSQKILYPKSLGLYNHLAITGYALNDDDFNDIRTILNLKTHSRIVDFRTNVEEALRNEILEHDYNTVIISNEHMSSRLFSREELSFLKEFLNIFFDEIRIIIYLREQSSLFKASISTAIKAGAPININS